MRDHDFERRGGLSFVAALLTLAACGGKETNNHHQEQANGAGATATAGIGGAEMSGGGAGGGAVAGGGTGTSRGGEPNDGGSAAAGETSLAQCGGFANETGSLVGVRLTNQTSATIYLGPTVHGCTRQLFDVADANGALDQTFSCLSCQDVISGNVHPCLCPAGVAITLEPGQSVAEVWSSTYARERELPDGCATNNLAASCIQTMGAAPGRFTFSSQAAKTLDCSELGEATCPACTSDNAGACYTAGALLTGPFITAQVTVELDASYGLGSSPGEAGAADQLKSVGLVFND